MTDTSRDILRRNLEMLASLQANIGTIKGLVPEAYVHEFHVALENLKAIGIDVSQYRISDSMLRRTVIQTCIGEGSVYSQERYVERAFLLTKLDAIIKYLNTLDIGNKIDTITTLERIFSRFHQVARQLRSRHGSRETLDVHDEYDVQDLLHALLKLYFDDIRPEEWTPSYAGGSGKMDFLLKDEKIVIEVKKTRDDLRDKKIGDQLTVDIARYKEHPDCKTLACFVYDPEGKLGNPKGLEGDLAKSSTESLNVRVFISPK